MSKINTSSPLTQNFVSTDDLARNHQSNPSTNAFYAQEALANLSQRLNLSKSKNDELTVGFTALGIDTEEKLAIAGFMAIAAKSGIAEQSAQVKFAKSMIAKYGIDLTNNNQSVDDKFVKNTAQGKSVSFEINAKMAQDLKAFRAEYIAQGGKIAANRNPTVNLNNINLNAIDPLNLTDKTQKTTFSVYLNNNGKPLTKDRIIAQYAQDRYQSSNLWGDDYSDIGKMSVAQGISPKIIRQEKVGDKIKITFDLSLPDQIKVDENYKQIQAKANEIDKFREKYNRENPLSQFILGAIDGAWDSVKGNANVLLNPIETINGIIEAVSSLSNLTAEDLAKAYEYLKESGKNLVTTKEGINSLPHKVGYAVGLIIAEAITAKGIGAVLEGLNGVKGIESFLTKLDEFKGLAKAKVAEKFSDEAAKVATQEARRILATTLYSGIPLDALEKMAIVAGNKIGKGVIKFGEFSKQMVAEFGEKIRPKLLELYQDAFEKVHGVRKTLDLDELLGGHSIEKHIGKSESWLRQRLLNEPDIEIASSFRNYDIANRTIAKAVKENNLQISNWLQGDKVKLVLKAELNEKLGIVLERGKGGSVGLKTAKDTNKAEIILVKDNSPQGWHVLTSYPTK